MPLPRNVTTGPVPVPAAYNLGLAADVNPQDGVDWQHGGLIIDPYPAGQAGKAGRFDEYGTVGTILPDDGTGTVTGVTSTKYIGAYPVSPGFDPFIVYTALTCSAIQGRDEQKFVTRTRQLLEANWWEATEREFYRGRLLSANPHLTSDLGSPADHYPLGIAAAAVSPVRALNVLENAIAAYWGRGGAIIHCTPGLLDMWSGKHTGISGGKIRTTAGTLIAPGAGYVNAGSAEKATAVAATAFNTEWVWATGPVQVRHSPIETAQPIKEVLDRTNNVVTFRAEKLVLVTWEATMKIGVLVDLTTTTTD